MGDPSKELQRMEVLTKEREEAKEKADYRAEERGHVRLATAEVSPRSADIDREIEQYAPCGVPRIRA